MSTTQLITSALLEQYSWLALPAFIAFLMAKMAYPYFQKWFSTLCNKYPTLKRWIDPDFCIGCCVLFYVVCFVCVAVGLAWLLYYYPSLLPPAKIIAKSL